MLSTGLHLTSESTPPPRRNGKLSRSSIGNCSVGFWRWSCHREAGCALVWLNFSYLPCICFALAPATLETGMCVSAPKRDSSSNGAQSISRLIATSAPSTWGLPIIKAFSEHVASHWNL